MERWHFVQDRSGGWAWRCTGTVRTRQAGRRFGSVIAAMHDAEESGMRPGLSRIGWMLPRKRMRLPKALRSRGVLQ